MKAIKMRNRILLIDNDKDFLSDLSLLLSSDYEIITAVELKQAKSLIELKTPDIILLDLMLDKGQSGFELLDHFRINQIDIPVIIVTDYSSVSSAVEAMKKGAFDYITKSMDIDELNLLIEKALNHKLSKLQFHELTAEINKPYSKIIGVSSATEEVRKLVQLFSDNRGTVLITGESGVGKELVARQIHKKGSGASAPFIAVNCGAIPKDIAESELFGYEKGAFTGAETRKPGKFEIAGAGTLFLDEISELDLIIQVKLLRVLQEKEFERVGGSTVIKCGARIIAATNKDLRSLVKRGEFREDLFYRLDVLNISISPLRERKDDILPLLNHLKEVICKEMNLKNKDFTDELTELLLAYNWPGNVREMNNVLTRALLLSSANNGPLTKENFPGISKSVKNTTDFDNEITPPETWAEMNDLRRKLSDKISRRVEALFVENLLKKFNGNITRAAEYAGINRINLHKMINKSKDL